MEVLFILFMLFLGGAHAATLTITNACPYTVWPGISTNPGSPPLPAIHSGFELPSNASRAIDAPATWSGRMWARTHCDGNSTGYFTCRTGDCRTGLVECGALPLPPVTYVELSLRNSNANVDSYLVSVAAGFNVPVSVIPPIGGGCSMASCPADVNEICLPELRVVEGGGGKVIACMSACQALKDPENCCNNGRSNCHATKYSQLFKRACPMAMSYIYDDTATFSCAVASSNYLVTFCPVLGV